MITEQDLPVLNQKLSRIAEDFNLKQETKAKWEKAAKDKDQYGKEYQQIIRRSNADLKSAEEAMLNEIILRFLNK